ncbi:MAG: hypothetical protein LUH47_05395 [Clostridiales bacterium]|nr:hypothetical protein [Clostridiales bacterium]
MVDTTSILINGKTYTINRILKGDKNYICLSDLAKMGFNIGYDSANKIPSVDNSIKEINISVDGEEKTVDAVNISGYNYCKLRDITKAVGNLEIDYKDSTVIINTK